jgi:hypothetical protein
MSDLPDSKTFPIDADHGLINYLVPVTAIVAFFVACIATNQILIALNADFSTIISLLPITLAVIVLIASIVLAELVYRRLIPPRRTLLLDSRGLALHDRRRETDQRIDWDKHINLMAWKFIVKRGSARVQRGAVLLGLQLQQDETIVSLYAFVPSKEAEALPLFKQFSQLLDRKTLEREQLSIRDSADQRRLLRAEDERWKNGGELHKSDFPILLEAVAAHVQDWQKVP